MTSRAVISAHCGKQKEVVIQFLRPVPNSESQLISEKVIQDGESHELVFYDDCHVVTFERDIPSA